MGLFRSFIAHLNKPEYIFRPSNVVRRVRVALNPNTHGSVLDVCLPWGCELSAGRTDAIGRSIANIGIYEPVVSEVLWRVTEPGDVCVDAGANIGYMTSLMASRSGPAGLLFAFEPHPKIFARLVGHVDAWRKGGGARAMAHIIPHQRALGARPGSATLREPAGFAQNCGTASLSLGMAANNPDRSQTTYEVLVVTLDQVMELHGKIDVLKIDVEGAEHEVLQGAEQFLRERRIRDILYEDFSAYPSPCSEMLEKFGYTVWRLAKNVMGPRMFAGRHCLSLVFTPPWEPTNFLATIDSPRVLERLHPRGWFCLRQPAKNR